MTHEYSYNPKTLGRRGSDEEEEDGSEGGFPFMDVMKKKAYKEFAQTFTAQHIHYYISKGIGAADDYIEMVYRMTVAGPQDVIFIHLNTPGGQLDTGVQIINAMQNSQAKIVTVLEGCAYSLGTLIFLAGDEMVVNENSLMMFHNFNGGLIGKGNEMVSELAASVKWFELLGRNIYVPFLTDDEFNRLLKGEDFWMQTDEIRDRLEKMVKIMADEEIAEQKAALAALQRAEREAKKAARKTPVKKAPGYTHGPARQPRVPKKPA